MEQQQLQLALTALLGIGSLLILIIVIRNLRERKLPGPRGWPLVGHIPLLAVGGQTHENLTRLARKYGPVFFLKLGSVNVVVVSSNKMADEFLKTNDRIWSSRPTFTAPKMISYDCQDIAFSEYGPRWRFGRKAMMELLTTKRLTDNREVRKQEILKGIKNAIDACCNGTKHVRLDHILGKMTMNTVTRMLMNDGEPGDKANTINYTDEFVEMIKEVFAVFGVFYLGDYFPWLDRFDPQGLKKRFRAVTKKFDDVLQNIVDDHKTRLKAAEGRPGGLPEGATEDMVYSLLTRPVEGKYLDETGLKALMQDVLLAGTDTNSTTIEWAIAEWLRNPHILRKLKEEMYSVVGKERLVEETDLPNLPYLDAVVKETFRVHPVGPLVFRASIEDCQIQGYKIPARTTLFLNVWAVHRDPELYDDPDEFRPERHLSSGSADVKDAYVPKIELLSFGAGKRLCPGKALGILIVQYTMALLIQTCSFSLPAGMKPEEFDMEGVFAFNLWRRTPLEAVVVPALPTHLLHGSQK